MLTSTMPIATTPEQVWVFISADTGAVDVARLAHYAGSTTFIALPVAVFDPHAVIPAYPTGELVPGFRWATVADIEAHTDVFRAAW